jgi:hypothetical protein
MHLLLNLVLVMFIHWMYMLVFVNLGIDFGDLHPACCQRHYLETKGITTALDICPSTTRVISPSSA